VRELGAPGDFQRLTTEWTSRRPAATALRAFVEDKFRARHDTAIFSKVENHEAFWILTDQEGLHAGRLPGTPIVRLAYTLVNNVDQVRLNTGVVGQTKNGEGTSQAK
jgi:hypothetical protein